MQNLSLGQGNAEPMALVRPRVAKRAERERQGRSLGGFPLAVGASEPLGLNAGDEVVGHYGSGTAEHADLAVPTSTTCQGAGTTLRVALQPPALPSAL